MKKIILFLFFFLTYLFPTLTQAALVEDIFSDISKDYIYRDELQTLYDRGMIIPDSSGKFSPNNYLNRDEFVGISMEVICERCIAPHTDFEFLEKYSNSEIYFDINTTNPYFYCVAEADARNYVRGYDLGVACENGTSKFGERPFCPLNRINLEEAIAVLLRNSNIFTIDDNQIILDRIKAGSINEKLGNDVLPRDGDNNPYTFYGYIQKALGYEIQEYTSSGKEKIYKLLEVDTNGNVNPKKQITKEEFLRMSYIALKSNSCSKVSGADLALAIDIWEKSCKPGDTNCTLSKLNDPKDTYDFTPKVEGFCEDGIDDPSGYTWRFYNTNTKQEFFRYGTFLHNIILPSIGEWRVYLTVKDRCGSMATVYSTIIVYPKDIPDIPVDQEIDVDIDIFDDNCTGSNAGCKEIEFETQEDDGDDIFDFDGDVNTSCQVGSIDYKWTLSDPQGKKYYFYTEFIDNFYFFMPGVWHILLEVKDGCNQTGSEELDYKVVSIPNIILHPPECALGDINCVSGPLICEGEVCEKCNKKGDTCDITVKPEPEPPICPVPGVKKYSWRIQNTETGELFNFTGKYVNNFTFLSSGRWKIDLTVKNNCGENNLTKYVKIGDTDIIIYPPTCKEGDTNCPKVVCDPETEICGGCSKTGDICDVTIDPKDPPVPHICPVPGALIYDWNLRNTKTGETFNFTGKYIDNFDFLSAGRWKIQVTAKNNCGGDTKIKYLKIGDTEKQYIDVDIDVFDDNCTGSNAGCKEIEFEDEEDDGDDIFDFDGDVDTSCKIGVIEYKWTFQKNGTSKKYNFYTEFVDNFEFLEAGVWNILLEVKDGCGQTGSEQMTYIVKKETPLGLNVDIIANPIIGYKALEVDFEAVIYGGSGPYTYTWSFGDGGTAIGKNVEHLFLEVSVYEVLLTVVDSQGRVGTATVLIKVLDRDICTQDSDGDGGNDCEDLCPLVPGPAENFWCPINETPCTSDIGCEVGFACNFDSTLEGEPGVCLPSFDPRASCLYNPDVGSIFGSAVCLSCPCSSTLDFLAEIRKCDFVFPAITSTDAKQIYSQGRVWQVPE